MEKKDFKDGDKVILSWKEDEGNGGYSNKRQKHGTVHDKGDDWFVETDINPTVRWQDITAITSI